MTSEPYLRVRTLTAKAMANYAERVQKYQSELDKAWSSVQNSIETNSNLSEYDTIKLKTIKALVIHQFNDYDAVAADYQRYLVSTRTQESQTEVENLVKILDKNRKFTNEFVDKIRSNKHENGSVGSKRSHSSSKSSKSSMVRLQTAKARAAFAEKSAELERKKAEIEEKERIDAAVAFREKINLEIDLKLLEDKKEFAITEAELEQSETDSISELDSIPNFDAKVRTAEFINQSNSRDIKPTLNPDVQEFVPQADTFQTVPNMSYVPQADDLTNYIVKKELVMSRLVPFNDRPENYIVWRATFQTVIVDLKVTPTEEFDLLIKYLGPESRRHAISLRTAHMTQPTKGLHHLWSRLDERYGTPEIVHRTMLAKLDKFPRMTNRDKDKLYELSDILSEIEALKTDHRYTVVLSYFDSTVGTAPIVSKLPYNLQEKWATRVYNYKKSKDVPFPPFSLLCEFVLDQARIHNDPGLSFSTTYEVKKSRPVIVKKTDLKDDVSREVEVRCPIHKTQHSLENCRAFKVKTFEEKRKILRDSKLCFRCFSDQHVARECKSEIKCSVCSSKTHSKLMHIDSAWHGRSSTTESYGGEKTKAFRSHGGEEVGKKETVTSKCTEICGNVLGKSCAKVILVNMYTTENPENVVKCYAILDDQSNKSLAKPELFAMLGIDSKHHEYVLSSCAGTVVTTGRRADHCVVESIDGSIRYMLPTLIECTEIPSNKNEICTPENARCHKHLYSIADCIPDFDVNADILLLVGRDVTEAHHVIDQVVGPPGAPFAQRLGLGWVVIGEVCIGQIHTQEVVNVNKTHVLGDGRASLFKPCESRFSVCSDPSQDPVFIKTPDDDKISLSIEDREFLKVMDDECCKGPDGSWVAPLPFRSSRQKLPNNKVQAVSRAKSLEKSLLKNHAKKQHFFDFMAKLFANGHAEVAPDLKPDEECWYLPLFGVYHPKKPDQIRVVFDSSAVFEGLSLNSVLLQGPDLTNSLVGVLMRFRRDEIAVMADVEQMFYSFSVHKKHRNFLRFLWYQDNDPCKPLVEFRMCKHVFGNSPSPAVATYGLRKSVEKSDADVREFVAKDFYVDDGLTSQPSALKAVDLLQRTQSGLLESGLRLHKIASNDAEVIKCFPSEDLAKNLKDLDFECGDLPNQRSLGVGWNINRDVFSFKSELSVQPVTKRGILSTINSVFDPLGFLAPVVLEGRLILRNLMSTKVDWDDHVSADIEAKWESWRHKLKDLQIIQIQRSYFNGSLSQMDKVELHIFSDASMKGIAAVVYVLGHTVEGVKHVGFVVGKSKVAPEKGHTIPRLELCAAVVAVELFQSVSEHIGVRIDDTKFYTDSKVVLGYICNQSKRFYTYVSNRVQRIVQASSPSQWNYVPTDQNPADIGSRGASVLQLTESMWLRGPEFLLKQSISVPEYFPLLNPEKDQEVRSEISVKATNVEVQKVSGCKMFERFSSWQRLIRAVSILRHIALSYHQRLPCKGWHLCTHSKDVVFQQETNLFVLREVQRELYAKEFKCLTEGNQLNKDSSLLPLNPVLGKDGLLRVGGRLNRSNLSNQEKNPIILSGKHPVSKLLVQQYHESVRHQGRHFTEGAVRSAGFWITGGKRLVSSVIHDCVVCKRLRGQFANQQMSELPVDRVEQASPFSYVGLDVFGPWQVVCRRTRGGQASSKRWAVLFTCLTIRAVHIEIVEEMSSSAFVNALRRFISIRGKVKQYRSDRGTNFVGATDNIQVDVINVEDEITQSFLHRTSSVWLFNSPHSSHMGGSWERMIGVARRILDAMLLNVKTLTHDVLVTLMAEVVAIINSRPIVSVSNDPDVPEVLSPSALLTQKLQCEQHPIGDMNIKNLYKEQWQQVQFLASQFWLRWSREYLQSLQGRRKWHQEQEPLKVDDVVLLKDLAVARNCWPMGRVTRVFPSRDGRIRKVEVCVMRDGSKVLYTRPVVELVLLVGK